MPLAGSELSSRQPLGLDRLDLIKVRLGSLYRRGVLRQALDQTPFRKTIIDPLLCGLPCLNRLFPITGLVLDGDELLVADESLDVFDFGHGGREAGSGASPPADLPSSISLARNSPARMPSSPLLQDTLKSLEQLPEDQAILHRQRCLLDPEIRLRDLVLVELAQGGPGYH